MKAVFITFNQASYEMIVQIMNRENIRGYTFWENIAGRGSHTGEPHLGTHAWPTMNSAIIAMMDDSKVKPFLDQLHELDMQAEAQGLRAFVLNVEESI